MAAMTLPHCHIIRVACVILSLAVDEASKVVGHIRVKPSGVLWAPSNAKVWYGVSLKEFAAFLETNGKKQDK